MKVGAVKGKVVVGVGGGTAGVVGADCGGGGGGGGVAMVSVLMIEMEKQPGVGFG